MNEEQAIQMIESVLLAQKLSIAEHNQLQLAWQLVLERRKSRGLRGGAQRQRKAKADVDRIHIQGTDRPSQ